MSDEPATAKPSRIEAGIILFVICVATGLIVIGRIDAASWVGTVTWALAIYFLKQPAGVFATGWTAQAVIKANKI